MKRRSALGLETLEARETPAAFGTPWPDGQNLTLSFAPNGTNIAGQPSNLLALLQSASPSAKLDILRAFQTWAVSTNVNIGLVGDTGAAFGTGGAVQGDTRFGDIRVGGVPLPNDVLAITAPYAQYDNYSGNVVLNTALTGADYDLYTILLQEAGHALGVGNSDDPASAMYEIYQTARAGLSAGDLAAIRSLYGTRTADQYEGAAGNNTRQTASSFLNPITADITSTNDVDFYRFTTGLLANRIDIDLTAAGLSLLTARVELLDSNGNVLATAAATDPTSNDLSLTLNNPQAFRTYYVRVSSSNTSAFGVGSYELNVTQNSIVTGLTAALTALLNETGLNDTLFTATSLLSSTLNVGPQTEYSTDARFGSSSDVDYYRVTVPPAAGGGPVNLITTVWGKDGAAVNAWVQVRDALGNTLPFDVLNADGRTTTIQVRGLTPGSTYFIRTSSDGGATGGYHLSADLTTATQTAARGATGTLTSTNASTTGTLAVPMSGQVHFVLETDGGPAELTVRDASGNVVTTLGVAAGRGRSVTLFLAAGNYQVSVRRTGTANALFELRITGVTDPVGARTQSSTGTVAGSGSGTTGGSGSGSGSGTGGGTTGTGSSGTQPSWYTPPSSADNATWY